MSTFNDLPNEIVEKIISESLTSYLYPYESKFDKFKERALELKLVDKRFRDIIVFSIVKSRQYISNLEELHEKIKIIDERLSKTIKLIDNIEGIFT